MDPRTPQPAKQCQFERQLIYERYGYSSIEPRMLRPSIKPRLIHRRYGDLSIEPRMHRFARGTERLVGTAGLLLQQYCWLFAAVFVAWLQDACWLLQYCRLSAAVLQARCCSTAGSLQQHCRLIAAALKARCCCTAGTLLQHCRLDFPGLPSLRNLGSLGPPPGHSTHDITVQD